MEFYILIISLIIIGNLSPLFASLLSKTSIESITNGNGSEEVKAKFIEIKELLRDSELSFYIYEFIFCILGAFVFEYQFQEYNFLELYTIYIILYLFVRFMFVALGAKLSKVAILFFKFYKAIYSLSKPFEWISKKFELIFGYQEADEASREELNALVEEAMEDGSLDAGEYRILKNIIHFKNVYVTDVMTPRTVIFSFSESGSVEELLSTPESLLYSRIPIWEGDSLDEGISGYVMTKDILRAALQGKSKIKVKKYKREIDFIPENAELDIALNMFLQRKQHIFMVVDEYGGIEGILTMEDVLETILGAEIMDEADKVEDLRELAKNLRDKRIATNVILPDEEPKNNGNRLTDKSN